MELRITMPQSTSDLKPLELRYISLLFLQGYSGTEFLVKAFLFLSGIRLQADMKPEPDGARWYRHRSLKKPFLLEADKLSEMAGHCRFLLEPGEIHPQRWIGLARARHFRLYNATFEEYLMAENYYFAYIRTKKDRYLDNLVSCLYRRPWQRWDAARIQKRAGQFRNVKPEVKNAVFMWYIGFRSYVPKRCPELFSGRKSKRPFNVREYINGMVHQLSNGDITIKDKLLRRPVWDALDELEQRAIDYELSKPD